jgi:hypothetical protein
MNKMLKNSIPKIHKIQKRMHYLWLSKYRKKNFFYLCFFFVEIIKYVLYVHLGEFVWIDYQMRYGIWFDKKRAAHKKKEKWRRNSRWPTNQYKIVIGKMSCVKPNVQMLQFFFLEYFIVFFTILLVNKKNVQLRYNFILKQKILSLEKKKLRAVAFCTNDFHRWFFFL